METKEVTLEIGETRRKATITYSTTPPSIQLNLDDLSKTCHGESLFSCFIELRRELSNIKFFCKGAKKNVHPSRMSSQMSSGLMAYELEIGKQALRKNMVNIFDYEENDLTNDPDIQSEFFANWMKSLK
ncbi:hypothetical protein K5D34_25500 [Pseudomonas cichorii]|nr:hypothetical protein [Pseudomonas cichorii]MBX8513050.1 hypothetical protein [Pseudomonas cichorii]MBX8528014.1 hypothetical protein [Pseudomonas cichorii]MBX8547935.1 hypothetical protein [Pseudomonas cichorii]